MTISTRTPEGTPNCCPVCGHGFRVEPSKPFGDAPCPACGTLLRFVRVGETVHFHNPESSQIVERIASRLEVSPSEVRSRRMADTGLDSLSIVELVMELAESQIGPD